MIVHIIFILNRFVEPVRNTLTSSLQMQKAEAMSG